MRIATWNINSIRARMDRLIAWIERSDVDVLAIQETKIPDDKFPVDRFTELGYQVAHHGTNQWNGVAVLSRVGITDVEIGVPGLPSFGDPAVAEARAVSAVCGGVRVWSLYVPNGRAIGDPHYYYKLEWLAAIRDYGAKQLAGDPQTQLMFCGDFNIAPTDDDIWSVEYYRNSTHVTAPERQAFHDLVNAGFCRCRPPVHTRSRGLHLLGLHPVGLPETARHADRLRAGQPGVGGQGDRGVDRSGRTQGQTAVGPRAGHRASWGKAST